MNPTFKLLRLWVIMLGGYGIALPTGVVCLSCPLTSKISSAIVKTVCPWASSGKKVSIPTIKTITAFVDAKRILVEEEVKRRVDPIGCHVRVIDVVPLDA